MIASFTVFASGVGTFLATWLDVDGKPVRIAEYETEVAARKAGEQ